nr:AraC family transcriptional regulator [uncultured Undibacterium sp.]
MDMDILEDVLQQAGLKARILDQHTLAENSTLRFPCDRSIGFHVATKGRAYIYSELHPQVIVLNKGDIALMARGHHHFVSTSGDASYAQIAQSALSIDSDRPQETTSQLTLVSGAYQIWHTPVHPLFFELPDWVVLRSDDLQSFDGIAQTIRMLAEEVAQQDVGAQRITNALLDILFTQVLREIMRNHQVLPQSWSKGLQQPQIRRALTLMHSNYQQEWALDELAHEVGLSRTSFAVKFKQIVGTTPLQYLLTIRIQKAIHLLSDTSDKLEAISQQVGYKDAFSFSKAFKKITGVSPKEFRLQDGETKGLAWRF